MVEFALIAPAFFMMLFGLVEFSRLAWMQQTLDEVAYSTARCMSVQTSCSTLATQRSHAVDRAAGYGITVTSANVTPATNTTCKTYAGSNSVTITANFNSPVTGMIPGLSRTLTARACFPVLS